MVLCLLVPVQAYHIPSVNEGLLSEQGCYVGAYLGGNQGANDKLCVNFFMKAQPDPYETQYLDQPANYGEKKGKGISSIDTGIVSFRSDLDVIQPGSGAKQILFSRYYNMNFYPDNDYGKIQFTESEAPYVWAEKVIQQGGVPVIAFDPYALTDGEGKIDLSVKNAKGKTGTEVLKDLGMNLKTATEKYTDAEGRPATVIIWFAHEFNTAPSVNPEADDTIDSAHKKAFRKAFREAYTVLHQYGGDGIQVAWAGNIAQTKDDRKYYWPGYDDAMNQLPKDSVDWVGMTWYPWPEGPKTLDRFQGFYDFYARDRQHPFIFMETSADGWGDPGLERSLKLNQVRYLYNTTTLSQYPNIKGIIWFNVVKVEQRSGSDMTKVTKNFLIPDGQWDNHGQSGKTAGTVYSASNRSRAMLPDYPAAMRDSYFISSVPVTVGSPDVLRADFRADTTSGDAPLLVKFTDLSGGQPMLWLYQFGDGSTSDSPTPVHTYRKAGTYTVNLTIWTMDNTGGLIRTSTEKTAYITVIQSPAQELAAWFSAGPVSGPAPLQVRFTDRSTGDPIKYRYEFGDGCISPSPNATHTYYKPGTYTVNLTVWGTKDLKPVSNITVLQNLIVVT
jgi:PKD repeat protein